MANQLRYPNQHTHYFSCVLLYLFAEAQSEMVQEQITRILLERLIVHRPHPVCVSVSSAPAYSSTFSFKNLHGWVLIVLKLVSLCLIMALPQP